ncbi:hypothetical protein LguiB_015571 [Lonicera macranthoides]
MGRSYEAYECGRFFGLLGADDDDGDDEKGGSLNNFEKYDQVIKYVLLVLPVENVKKSSIGAHTTSKESSAMNEDLLDSEEPSVVHHTRPKELSKSQVTRS